MVESLSTLSSSVAVTTCLYRTVLYLYWGAVQLQVLSTYTPAGSFISVISGARTGQHVGRTTYQQSHFGADPVNILCFTEVDFNNDEPS